MTNWIKVKCIENHKIIGLTKGKIYSAIKSKDRLGGLDWLGVIDDCGEEYAYPASYFEIVEDDTSKIKTVGDIYV